MGVPRCRAAGVCRRCGPPAPLLPHGFADSHVPRHVCAAALPQLPPRASAGSPEGCLGQRRRRNFGARRARRCAAQGAARASHGDDTTSGHRIPAIADVKYSAWPSCGEVRAALRPRPNCGRRGGHRPARPARVLQPPTHVLSSAVLIGDSRWLRAQRRRFRTPRRRRASFLRRAISCAAAAARATPRGTPQWVCAAPGQGSRGCRELDHTAKRRPACTERAAERQVGAVHRRAAPPAFGVCRRRVASADPFGGCSMLAQVLMTFPHRLPGGARVCENFSVRRVRGAARHTVAAAHLASQYIQKHTGCTATGRRNDRRHCKHCFREPLH